MGKENLSKLRYVFYYPSERIGGAQLLFARVAKELINRNYQVLILENDKTCFITTYLREQKLNFELASVELEDKLKDSDILVLSLSYFQLVKNTIKPSRQTKIVFWDLHPFALLDALGFSKFHKLFPETQFSKLLKYVERKFITKVHDFIKITHQNKAIYFMAFENFKLNKELFDLNIEPNYLPIPIEIEKNIDYSFNTKAKQKNKINIAWISRLDPDKVPVLDLLIDDILKYNEIHKKEPIKLHIIGAGTLEKELDKYKNILKDNLVLTGKLFQKQLDTYLVDNIDVGFAMGTSVLEFAHRKIPAILVPSPVYIKFFNSVKERYQWLFEAKGFDVSVKKQIVLDGKTVSFETILSSLSLKGYEKYSRDSYNYLLQNHAMNVVVDKFIYFTLESKLDYDKMSKLTIFKLTILEKFLFKLKFFTKKYLLRNA